VRRFDMCAETRESKKPSSGCDPKGFQGMFEVMSKCCSGEKNTIDCSTMMEAMKKGGCCASKTEETKSDK
jgi:hypothetical protein